MAFDFPAETCTFALISVVKTIRERSGTLIHVLIELGLPLTYSCRHDDEAKQEVAKASCCC